MISVIIPNYNHQQYLQRRLNSILNQTFQDFELILLDDASTDSSCDILSKYTNHPKVSAFLPNKTNSGSPFAQWKKGIEKAKFDLIWIAESDDDVESNFLEVAVKHFSKIQNLSLFYCQSKHMDQNNNQLPFSTQTYASKCFENSIWNHSHTLSGQEYIDKYLVDFNIIQNASAVVFNKKYIHSKTLDEILEFKMAGDWYFWLSLIGNSMVHFSTETTNYFRESTLSTRTHDTYQKRTRRVMEELKIYQSLYPFLSVEQKNRKKKKLLSMWVKKHKGLEFFNKKYFEIKNQEILELDSISLALFTLKQKMGW